MFRLVFYVRTIFSFENDILCTGISSKIQAKRLHRVLGLMTMHSPEWDIICLFRFPASEKFLKHCLQVNGFSPEWVLICILNLLSWENLLGHTWQGYFGQSLSLILFRCLYYIKELNEWMNVFQCVV